ncbi:protein kinase domain-containing protein [Oerskovia turbata]
MEEATSTPDDPAPSHGAAPRGGLPSGAEVGGYRILARLGAGAMGAVYKAEDGGGNLVAIKFLHAHLDVDAQGRERLRREATALQRLRHPAVAQILDVELDGSEAFIVTELVDGPNLEEEIATGGPLDATDLFELADQLAEALEAVHAAGVVHRDLKPSNVLVTQNGPVLIDFGIAHGLDEARATSTGLVMGTPGYLAPELLEGAAPSANSDWWGWAALLAYAATGRPPFGMRPLEAVLARARSGEADLDGLPPRTAGALAAALRADPAGRLGPSEVAGVLHREAHGDGPTTAPATGAIPISTGVSSLVPPAVTGAIPLVAGATLAAAERAAAVGRPADAVGQAGADAAGDGAGATVVLPASANDVQPTTVVPTTAPVAPPAPPGASGPPLAATQVIANDGHTLAVPTGAAAPPSVPPAVQPAAVPPAAVPPAAVPLPPSVPPARPADLQPTLVQPVVPPGPYPPQPGPTGPYPPAPGPYPPQPGQPGQAPASGRTAGPSGQGGPALDELGRPIGEELGPTGYARPTHRRRAGSLLALALPLVLLAGSYPGMAFVLLAGIVVASRVVGVGASALHSRRERRGVLRSDGLRAVVAIPWHAVRAVVGAVPSLLVALSGGILIVVASWWALAPGALVIAPRLDIESRSVGGANEPWIFTVALCAAMAVTALLAWFGPVSATTRLGARTTLAHVAPGRVGAIFVVLAGLVLAAILLYSLDGALIDWAPFPGPPPTL